MHVKKLLYPAFIIAALLFSGCEQPSNSAKNDDPGTPAVESRYTLKSLAGTLTLSSQTIELWENGTGKATGTTEGSFTGDLTWEIVQMSFQQSARGSVSGDSVYGIKITPNDASLEAFELQIVESFGKFVFRKFDEKNEYVEFSSTATAPAFDITPASLSLEVGSTETLVCTDALEWKSSDVNVATVEDGKVVAVKKGTAIITATSKYDKDRTATCTVTVNLLGGENLPWTATYKKLPAEANGTWLLYDAPTLVVEDSIATWGGPQLNQLEEYLSYTIAKDGTLTLYSIQKSMYKDETTQWKPHKFFSWSGHHFRMNVFDLTKKK